MLTLQKNLQICVMYLLVYFNNKTESPCYPHLFNQCTFLPLCLYSTFISGFYLSSLLGHKSHNFLPTIYSVFLSQMSCSSFLCYGYISFKIQSVLNLALGLPLAKISSIVSHLRSGKGSLGK